MAKGRLRQSNAARGALPNQAVVRAALQAQQDAQGPENVRVVLQPYNLPEPPNPEIVAAWRVLKQEPDAEGIRVTLDELVEDPDADPLVLFRWPEGVLPPEKERHLVLWRDNLWWCPTWWRLDHSKEGIGKFSRFSLPLVKKAYPQLLAQNLVSVQPMTQPAGLVYYLRYRYSKTKAGAAV